MHKGNASKKVRNCTKCIDKECLSDGNYFSFSIVTINTEIPVVWQCRRLCVVLTQWHMFRPLCLKNNGRNMTQTSPQRSNCHVIIKAGKLLG